MRYSVLLLCASLLLLTDITIAQNPTSMEDKDYARWIVESLPNSRHGFNHMSGYDKKVIQHVKDHSKIYVDLIQQELGWPVHDSLFFDHRKAHLFSTLITILTFANSTESIQFMEGIYVESATKHDSLTIAIREAVIAEDEVEELENRLIYMEYLMESSVRGINRSKSDLILEDVLNRFDRIGFLQQSSFYRYIQFQAKTQPSAKEWLISRGLEYDADS